VEVTFGFGIIFIGGASKSAGSYPANICLFLQQCGRGNPKIEAYKAAVTAYFCRNQYFKPIFDFIKCIRLFIY
jgi:hypothetical protein